MVVGRWVEYKGWRVWVEDAWLGARSNFLDTAREVYESGWLTKLGVRDEQETKTEPKRRSVVKA